MRFLSPVYTTFPILSRSKVAELRARNPLLHRCFRLCLISIVVLQETSSRINISFRLTVIIYEFQLASNYFALLPQCDVSAYRSLNASLYLVDPQIPFFSYFRSLDDFSQARADPLCYRVSVQKVPG